MPSESRPSYVLIMSWAGKSPGRVPWMRELAAGADVEVVRRRPPRASGRPSATRRASFPVGSQGRTSFRFSRRLILKPRQKSGPTSRFTARTTSSAKRARFSSSPPHSSLRSLIADERNCVKSTPFAPASSTPSRPASRARRAACANCSITSLDLGARHRRAAESVQRLGLARRAQTGRRTRSRRPDARGRRGRAGGCTCSRARGRGGRARARTGSCRRGR